MARRASLKPIRITYPIFLHFERRARLPAKHRRRPRNPDHRGQHEKQHPRKPKQIDGAHHARLGIHHAFELAERLLRRQTRGLQRIERRAGLRVVRRHVLDQLRAVLAVKLMSLFV